MEDLFLFEEKRNTFHWKGFAIVLNCFFAFIGFVTLFRLMISKILSVTGREDLQGNIPFR